jgi:hypothetical protein
LEKVMKRHWAFAVAALIALPHLSQAQTDTGWGPDFRITPWIGVSPAATQKGVATVFTSSNIVDHRYSYSFGSSLSFGANAEARLVDRFSLVAGGMWSSRGKGVFKDFEDEVIWQTQGSTWWAAKAGLGIRLRETAPDMQLKHLNALVFVGPALIHDQPKVVPTTPLPATATTNHWGVNFGAEAELPTVNPRLAFQLGFEDWLVLWDGTKYGPQVAQYVDLTNPGAAVLLDANNTHVVMFRAGMSFRF